VLSSELSQYLRLHHRDLTFEQTVEKARIYHSTMDGTKPKKAIRFFAEPDADPNVLLMQPLEGDRGQVGQSDQGQQVHFFVDTVTNSDSVFDVDDCFNVILSSYVAAVELASTKSASRSAIAVRQPLRWTTEFPTTSTWLPAASTDIYGELVPGFSAASQPFQWTASRFWSSSSRLSSLWNCRFSQRFPSSGTTSHSTSFTVTRTRNGGAT